MATRASTQINRVRLLLATTALVYAGSIAAATRPAYSFSANDQYLTQSSDYPRWAALAARHAAQAPEIDACIDDATRCPRSLKGYREVVVGGDALSAERKMRLANRFINTRSWSVEPRRDDDWRTLGDFLRLGGDCEDFAIAKYFVLRRLGFPADDLRVAISWDARVHDHHAVTVVRIDGRIFVLDVDGAPRRRQDDYRFLFSINESGIWDHAAASTRHSGIDNIHVGAKQL